MLPEVIGLCNKFRILSSSEKALSSYEKPLEPGYHDLSERKLLEISAAELQSLLEAETLTSERLVGLYLDQIDRHNHKGARLHAVISTMSRQKAVQVARKLDKERLRRKREKIPRGPLYGIPIIIKDTLCTPTLGMDTTCGSFALQGAKAKKNAAVVDLLIKAGMIIIAKTNLTELGGMKGSMMTSGWSAVGGQTRSPYVRGEVARTPFLGHSTPCGSSSGSAVGVAAGFAPVSIGTETDGSLVQPATRAALYGMKATPGTVDTAGIQPISPAFDSVGGLAKTTEDLANIMGILLGRTDDAPDLKGSWEGLRVGFVDPSLWQPAEFVVEPNESFRKQTFAAMKEAEKKIRNAGARVVSAVDLIDMDGTQANGGEDIDDLMVHDFKASLDEYLALFNRLKWPKTRGEFFRSLKNIRRLRDIRAWFRSWKVVHTLEELIRFNEENMGSELPPDHPGQDVLLEALQNGMTREDYVQGLKSTRNHTRSAIQMSLETNGVDVIMGPADARIASVAAAAGYPVATVPLGFADFNGRAFGMNLITRENNEGTLLQVMSAWEQTFGPRKPPTLLPTLPPSKETAEASKITSSIQLSF